ncbi:MAG: hypothetical protein ACYCWE_01070 [Eubacteriales bacterium]
MYCESCGTELPEGVKNNSTCGIPTEKATCISFDITEAEIPPGIMLCRDGLIRWTYELSLWKNPTVLITLLKVFYGIVIGMAIFMGLLIISDGAAAVFKLIFQFIFFGIITATLLILPAYALYAGINGGKYCVVFEMDKKGINHIQMGKQFKKTQVLSYIGMLAGAMTGNITAVGVNMIAGSRQSMYSSFKSVNKVKAKRRRNVLYVNEMLNHNQIYASPEQFDYVFNFIKEHCPSSVKIKE